MGSRIWCFTLNNYEPSDEVLVQAHPDLTYVCYGREVGASGTPHMQGVLIIRTPQRLSWLRKSISPRAHYEVCRNFAASVAYCKKDGDYQEIDRRNRRGRKPSRTGQPRQLVPESCLESLIERLMPKFKFR